MKQKLNSLFSRSCLKNKLYTQLSNFYFVPAFFLLDVVQKFLGTESLKCLLDEESQTLLNHFVFLENVGMRLVCRLYWHQPRWYNADEVVKITVVDDLHEIMKNLVDCGFIILSKSEGEFLTYKIVFRQC